MHTNTRIAQANLNVVEITIRKKKINIRKETERRKRTFRIIEYNMNLKNVTVVKYDDLAKSQNYPKKNIYI